MIKEYLSIVNGISAVYYDSCQGFKLVGDLIEKTQRMTSIRVGKSMEELDDLQMIYGRGDPNSSNCKAFFSVKQREVKARNSKNGVNTQIIGNLCVVLIYQFWEDRYRAEIARSLNIKKSELTLDIMGDLRIIRRSIIHNQGNAIKEIKNCKIIKAFKEERAIYISDDIFEEIVQEIVNGLESLTDNNSLS